MHRVWWIPFLLALLTGPMHAQHTTTDSAWTLQLAGALNLTQVSLSHWAGGGTDALAWTAMLAGQTTYHRGWAEWSTQGKVAFGQSRLAGIGVRKSDDQVDLSSTLTARLNLYVNPYLNGTLHTQMAPGYAYAGPDRAQVSSFWNPASLTQTVGVGCQPIKSVKVRLGFGVRESAVRTVTVNAGAEAVLELDWRPARNMQMTGKLAAFAPGTAQRRVSLRGDGNLACRVNRLVGVSLGLQLVRDRQVAARLQAKEVLALGLNYVFL